MADMSSMSLDAMQSLIGNMGAPPQGCGCFPPAPSFGSNIPPMPGAGCDVGGCGFPPVPGPLGGNMPPVPGMLNGMPNVPNGMPPLGGGMPCCGMPGQNGIPNDMSSILAGMPPPPGMMPQFPGFPCGASEPGGMPGNMHCNMPPTMPSTMPGTMPGVTSCLSGSPPAPGAMQANFGTSPGLEKIQSGEAPPPPPNLGYFGGGPDVGVMPPRPPANEDIRSNVNHYQCTGKTINDQEVKVQDPSGRQMAHVSRCETFSQAPFPPIISNALKKAGFPAPSQIQQYCWPLAAEGKDVIGVAATGSGKTIAFLLPAFATIIEKRLPDNEPSLCVIAPTRELAIQIQEEADKFAKPDIKTVCVYGGAPKGPQADALRRGCHGVIGTPGRLNDFIEGNQLQLRGVCKLVLDEADRMLDMGFEPQIRKILAKIPARRHTLFFTATWPPSVRRLAGEFLHQAYTVTIGNRDELKGNQDITQLLKSCRSHEKNQLVMQILKQSGVTDRGNHAKALVFCATKRMCDQLAQQLDRSGVPCAAVHGDKGQRDREAAINGLKEGRIKAVVATDVAARGLDIKGVTMVINFDPPSNVEDYVHRIGRTGRAGQKGCAVALISERDTHALRGIIQVMKRTNQNVTPEFEGIAKGAPGPPPSGRAMRGGGGPPPVQVDSNFQPGLSTGDVSPPLAVGDGSMSPPPAVEMASIGMGGSSGPPPRSFGGDFGGKGGGGDRFADRFKGGGDRFADRDRGPPRGKGSRRSPSRRRRSPSKRRRSPSNRRSRSRGRRDRSRSRRDRRRSRSRSRRRVASRDRRGGSRDRRGRDRDEDVKKRLGDPENKDKDGDVRAKSVDKSRNKKGRASSSSSSS